MTQYGPPGPFLPGLVGGYPVPHGSRMTSEAWRRANSDWRPNRAHPHGVPESFPWGAVMWSRDGSTALGLVVADPRQPVAVAHRAASELGVRRHHGVSRRTFWGAIGGGVPALTIIGATGAPDGLLLPGAVVVGAATAVRAGRWSRVTRRRRPWRHVPDPPGAAAVFPHLRWLCDLVEEVPEQADLVMGGVRDVLWLAPQLADAADPVAKIATALARTARARRSRDDAVHARPGDDGPARPRDAGRMDDIAAGVVGALGFEEEVYRRVADDYDALAADERATGSGPDDGTAEPR